MFGNCPVSAQYNPCAPWLEEDHTPVVEDIEYSCTLIRKAPVTTTDYTPGRWEADEEGCGYRVGDDFSGTDWLCAFRKCYRTPVQLLQMLRTIAEDLAKGQEPKLRDSKFWVKVAEECSGWGAEDEFAEQTEPC